MSPAPKVAVLGRQNVGKSTLANRLVGGRHSIADDAPGVTRDRIEADTMWRGRTFTVVDTAGYRPDARGVEARAAEQATAAAREADLILLVVDVRSGVSEDDALLARRLRRVPVPVVVVANKADAEGDEIEHVAFHSLGLGDPVPVSAISGRGSGELLDRIVALLPERGAAADAAPVEPRFAIIGRPNVGKSSLFNRLIGNERSVVFEEAGTTRDAVDAVVTWPGTGAVRFVDTAGMRRGQRVRGIEYYSVLRASRALERADAALVVIDAAEGFGGEDRRIARSVIEAGRGLLVVANKWDLVEDRARLLVELKETLAPFARASVMRTSAMTGLGVHRLPPVLVDLHRRWSFRASTSKVNEILQAAQAERPAPRGVGTLRYGTQVQAGPPTFVLFGFVRAPDPAYRRFLERRLREAFDLDGVPIAMRFRSGRTR